MQTLSEHAIPRTRFLLTMKDAVVNSLNDANSGGILLVLGGPSGRGKSSALSLLAQELEEEKGIQVIYHFVGSSDRSDELSTTARRIVSELKSAWGESVDDTAIADGDTEACALARQTILRGPMSGHVEAKQVVDPLMSAMQENRVVLFVDAVNQLRCGSEHILDWLPGEEDIASLPKGLVIVVSCTPGPELESLVRRAEKCSLRSNDNDNPTYNRAFEIPSLDSEDKKNIATGLLNRHTKLFSESQMQNYLEIPGSCNPLWQNVAMFYLRKYATFESLSTMISSLPSNVDSLIEICLSKAETIIGRIYVKSFLLGVCLTRQGLWESEALQLLPILVKQLSVDNEVASDPPQEVNMFIWSHLRSSLDVFLHQNVVGSQAVLAPSHNIVRDAIIYRYKSDTRDNSEIVLRTLADFFQSSSTVHQSRKFLETSWACLCLRDYTSLSRFLRTPEVMLHQWRFSGDSGRWSFIKLWKDVDELRAQSNVMNSETETGQIDDLIDDTTSVSVQEITEWAGELSVSLVEESGLLSNQTFAILRAIYDLLDSMRRSNASLNFLRAMEDLVICKGNQSDIAVQICLAWIHYSIGNCLNDRGDYSQAAAKIEQALAEFEAISDIHPHRCVANLYLSLGKIFDELKRYDEALSVFNKAEVTYKAISLSMETYKSINPIVAMLMDEFGGSSSSLRTELATAEADVAKEIANVMFSLERFDDAMEYYTKAFVILRRNLGENHPKTARAMWGFGIVQKSKEDFYGSIETYEKVLNIFMIALGPHHPDTADMSYNIATSYSELKQYDIALSHYISAIKVYIKVYGERHRDVAFTWNDIGCNELAAGRLNAAISAFETALSIREEIFGPDDECTLATKTLLEKTLDQQQALPGLPK
jgi:tetratricopeptide (TPR) repeat protein/energy-coupling factor transporter ATP-binding protein EcfA2